MLVYGDVETVETVGAKQAAVRDLLQAMDALPPGIERHGMLVSAFIGTSELVQGLIDAEFHERGVDTHSRSHEDGMACLSVLARAVDRSWRSGFRQAAVPPSFLESLLG